MMGLPKQYMRYPDGGIEPIDPRDPDEAAWFAEWYNDERNRTLEKTAVLYGDLTKAIVVKTVFLPFGDDPVFFETNVGWESEDRKLHQKLGEEIDKLGSPDETEESARARHRLMTGLVEQLLENHGLLRDPEEEMEDLLSSLSGKAVPKVRTTPLAKDFKAKPSNPECGKCQGSGEVFSVVLGMAVPCDCTVQRRTAD